MHAGAVSEAAIVFAPKAGRVLALPFTTTAARFVIPADFRGVQCKWMAVGAAADINFGDAAVSCTYAQASGVASEAITANAATGWHLLDGIADHWVMPAADQATHFCVDGAASGTLFIQAA